MDDIGYQENRSPEWVKDLTGENFLAVYDVILDMRQASQLCECENIVIPLWQQLVKFGALMPLDSIKMRDRYCDFRWRATGLLKKQEIIKEFSLLRGAHRWESRLKISADSKTLNSFAAMMDVEFERRSKPAKGSEQSSIVADNGITRDTMEEVRRLILRFHAVAIQLRKRHDDRHTLAINDEYDVQDLLRALLCLQFDDVRPEEWTPSYAGQAARVDFLLKPEKIIIEVKKTRQGLGTKEIGNQLILDIERYSKNQDCRFLICMIYDPENRIPNPGGLETDLSGDHRCALEEESCEISHVP